MMFEQALAARLPVIACTTDDPVNVGSVLGTLIKKPVGEFKSTVKTGEVLYAFKVPEDPLATYRKFANAEATLVLVNPEAPFVGFDGGLLPTPDTLIVATLTELGWQGTEHTADENSKMWHALRGMSLKAIAEVCLLAQAEYGAMTPLTVRKMRAKLNPPSTGLIAVDTSIDLYDPPPDLADWIKLVRPYFLSDVSSDRLAPRGILFHGTPGTGKTTAAKFIAREWNIPLYRLDLSTTLSKYIGESEAKMARTLAAVDREAPCVLLLDEVEKVFTEDDHGAVQRILSQLLWWLNERRSRVFVVMTTNNMTKIPPELYRPGRLDKVYGTGPLTHLPHAVDFAERVLKDVLPAATPQMVKTLRGLASDWPMPKSHAEATENVFDIIRTKRW
jgi:hypothetical protein